MARQRKRYSISDHVERPAPGDLIKVWRDKERDRWAWRVTRDGWLGPKGEQTGDALSRRSAIATARYAYKQMAGGNDA